MENLYLDVAIDTISEKCTMFVPPKQSKKVRFHYKRKIMMRKRFMKSSIPAPLIKSQLVMFEKQLCDSYFDAKLFEENAAVTKIQEDPNYFFRYAKNFVFVKLTLVLLCMNSATNSLSNDKHEMCCLLVDLFTLPFQTPNKLFITGPVSFFAHDPNTGIHKSLFLTDIMLNEDVIIETIHEFSPNSAAGPDCVPSSLLVNCATQLAPVLLQIFAHSLSHEVSQNLGRELLLF